MSSARRRDDPLQSVRDLTGDGALGTSLAGALLMTVVGFIPGSPLLGGAFSGYLVRDDRGRGTRAGALAGIWTTIPVALFGFAILSFTALVGMDALPIAAFGGLLLLFVLLGLLYTVGLAALGGYLGVVAYERRQGPARRDHAPSTGDPNDARDRY